MNQFLRPFYGIKIVRMQEFLYRKRTWVQRLFSWPWRPWVRLEQYENPLLPEKGVGFKIGDTFYMRESDAIQIERNLNDHIQGRSREVEG